MEIRIDPEQLRVLLWALAAFAAGLLLAALWGWRIAVGRRRRWEEERERLEERIAEGEARESQQAERLRRLEQERIRLLAELKQLPKLQAELAERDRRLEAGAEERLELAREVERLQTTLSEQERHYRQLTEELKEAREAQRKEFERLASQIMERNAMRFKAVSQEGVAQILKPLQQQVESFRKRIDEVHSEESRELASLLGEIRTLRELNRRIGKEAENLTRALKGESKTQGIWGEMVLERILEASGLRRGEEFEREVSLRDAQSRRFRPDVIVHLPGGRDIVIDAKTSLRAYERYVNAESDEARRLHARAHLGAVKEHIDALAEKNYAALEGIETLDFIFMFLPIEGALSLALQEDPGLYERALERQIVLVGPTTLLVALRAVESSWKRERQNRNAREIARRAGALYDKFALFAADLEKLGRQIETSQNTYRTLWNRLGQGKGNILRQIEGLRELGAQTSKELPEKLREESDSG
jgi:DNA recombination protein RmuC